MSRKPSLIFVFDFDGTLADTLRPLADIFNTIIAPTYKCSPVSEKDFERFRGMNPRKLMKIYGIPLYKLPFLVRRARQELFRRIDTVKPHKNIVSALRALKAGGYEVGVLTSNSRENVRRFLKHWELDKSVDFIQTGLNVFGKARQIKGLIKRRKVLPHAMIYIGDETRDVEAAKKAGVHSAAVAWGFNTPDLLEAAKPERLIRDPFELLEWGRNLHGEF